MQLPIESNFTLVCKKGRGTRTITKVVHHLPPGNAPSHLVCLSHHSCMDGPGHRCHCILDTCSPSSQCIQVYPLQETLHWHFRLFYNTRVSITRVVVTAAVAFQDAKHSDDNISWTQNIQCYVTNPLAGVYRGGAAPPPSWPGGVWRRAIEEVPNEDGIIVGWWYYLKLIKL